MNARSRLAPAAQRAPLPTALAQDAVFDTLLLRIVTGQYTAGQHLPAERELAADLGTSRSTLREALRRLEQWNLVRARRGSGVTVADVAADATLDVLPAYVRTRVAPAEAARLCNDLLELRRRLMLEVVRLVAGRVKPGDLDGARAALERAAAVRDDFARFTREDFAVIHAVARAASFLPGVWLLNSLRGIYVDLASALSPPRDVLPPARYRATYLAVFASLEAGRGDDAVKTLQRYLQLHDKHLRDALGFGRVA